MLLRAKLLGVALPSGGQEDEGGTGAGEDEYSAIGNAGRQDAVTAEAEAAMMSDGGSSSSSSSDSEGEEGGNNHHDGGRDSSQRRSQRMGVKVSRSEVAILPWIPTANVR